MSAHLAGFATHRESVAIRPSRLSVSEVPADRIVEAL